MPLDQKGLSRLSRASAISKDNKGSTGIIFAMALAPFVLLLGVTMDLSRATSLQQRLKLAADQAAVSATAALVNSTGNASTPSTLALNTWNANVAGLGITGTPTISVSTTGTATKTTVSYTGSMKTSFAALLGRSSLGVSVSSSASGSAPASKTTGFNGAGAVWGDPHVWETSSSATAFNTSNYNLSYQVSCPDNTNTWYNVLSDMGVELNMSCYSANGVLYGGMADFIYDIALVVEGHKIRLTQTPDTGYRSASTDWNGQISIDGTSYTNNSSSTKSYALTGTDFNTTILTNTAPSGVSASYFSAIKTFLSLYGTVYTVVTPNYTIYLGYWANGGGGSIAITANNAGQCGTPGGLWGKTLSGIDDTTVTDFSVSGPYATSTEYGRTNCTLGIPVHLTQ